MKTTIGAVIMALLFACVAVPSMVWAVAEEASAGGSFKFQLDEGEVKFVEFSARQDAEGQTAGEMIFNDPSAIPVEDPDEPEKRTEPGVLVKAKFDCMRVIDNRAVMGGEIFESNVPSTIGLRVLLVIEDNGAERDRLMWGVYQNPPTGWVPKDAERDDDDGAKLVWIATDFERRDDKGIPSNLSKVVRCETFPFEAFEFPEIKAAGGDLKIDR
jgi:hypothetical protein